MSAFGRSPTDIEAAEAADFLARQRQAYGTPDDVRAWADFCHVLFNAKEFLFIE
jgi:hypothetical protein